MVESSHRAVAGTPNHAQRNATIEPPRSIRDRAASSSSQKAGSESFRPYVSAIPPTGLEIFWVGWATKISLLTELSIHNSDHLPRNASAAESHIAGLAK